VIFFKSYSLIIPCSEEDHRVEGRRIRGVGYAKSIENTLVPCIFPCYQSSTDRAGFAADWFHRHLVFWAVLSHRQIERPAEFPANSRFLNKLQCTERHAAEVLSACLVFFSENEIVGGSAVRYRLWPPPLHILYIPKRVISSKNLTPVVGHLEKSSYLAPGLRLSWPGGWQTDAG
jgi:hypothetical protein